MENAKKLLGASFAYAKGYTGSGIGIAFLDTGVSPMADFTAGGNRIVCFKDFVRGAGKPYDDNGHGTQETNALS